jgi:phosphopantetheine--protein transferase-like protein
MKVIGCGIDIEELSRFNNKLPDKTGESRFAHLVYTPDEIKYNYRIRPELTFPLAFCCKEAVFKSFGVSWINSKISWKDIELLFKNDNLEDYTIKLHGYAEELFHKLNCNSIKSYFEYDDVYAMFRVMLCS